MNLFEDILNINHDILGGCGKSVIKIDPQMLKWEPFFGQIVKIHFTYSEV